MRSSGRVRRWTHHGDGGDQVFGQGGDYRLISRGAVSPTGADVPRGTTATTE